MQTTLSPSTSQMPTVQQVVVVHLVQATQIRPLAVSAQVSPAWQSLATVQDWPATLASGAVLVLRRLAGVPLHRRRQRRRLLPL